jgi:hypothetical protein
MTLQQQAFAFLEEQKREVLMDACNALILRQRRDKATEDKNDRRAQEAERANRSLNVKAEARGYHDEFACAIKCIKIAYAGVDLHEVLGQL